MTISRAHEVQRWAGPITLDGHPYMLLAAPGRIPAFLVDPKVGVSDPLGALGALSVEGLFWRYRGGPPYTVRVMRVIVGNVRRSVHVEEFATLDSAKERLAEISTTMRAGSTPWA